MIGFLSAGSVCAYEFNPYVGLNVGYGYLSAEENQLDKQGFNLGAKIIGSFKFQDYFLDAALGYQLEFFKADYISIQNNTPLAELSFRRKFGTLSAGPIIQAQSGVYSTQPSTDEKNEVITNVGLQMIYEPYENKTRYEVSLVNSIGSNNMDDRNLTAIRFGIHIPFGSKSSPKDKPVVKQQVSRNMYFPTLIVPGFLSKAEYVNQKTSLGFDKKSYKLDSYSKSKIVKLAKFLVDNKIEVKKIEITGHSDELGTNEYNQKLSQKRAEVVKEIFVKFNVDSQSLIITEGKSYLEPIAKLDKYSIKNRRTEIKLIDMKISDKLNQQLTNLINNKKE